MKYVYILTLHHMNGQDELGVYTSKQSGRAAFDAEFEAILLDHIYTGDFGNTVMGVSSSPGRISKLVLERLPVYEWIMYEGEVDAAKEILNHLWRWPLWWIRWAGNVLELESSPRERDND